MADRMESPVELHMFVQVGPVPVALRPIGSIGCLQMDVTHVWLINYSAAGASEMRRVFADQPDVNSQ